mgnify:CR=1 FL=1
MMQYIFWEGLTGMVASPQMAIVRVLRDDGLITDTTEIAGWDVLFIIEVLQLVGVVLLGLI